MFYKSDVTSPLVVIDFGLSLLLGNEKTCQSKWTVGSLLYVRCCFCSPVHIVAIAVMLHDDCAMLACCRDDLVLSIASDCDAVAHYVLLFVGRTRGHQSRPIFTRLRRVVAWSAPLSHAVFARAVSEL